MKTIELYLCDKCEKMIMPSPYPNPSNGFVVEGNIYAAEEGEGGLVGNNSPQDAEEIQRSKIRKTCLCKECFLEVLHLVPKKEEDDPWDGKGHPALYGIGEAQTYGKRSSQCLHDNCPSCGGTGMKKNGLGACIHMISCPCPKCSPRM